MQSLPDYGGLKIKLHSSNLFTNSERKLHFGAILIAARGLRPESMAGYQICAWVLYVLNEKKINENGRNFIEINNLPI